MPTTRTVFGKDITYSDARIKETNVLRHLGYHDQKLDFFNSLDSRRPWMQAVVAHHLALQSPTACQVAGVEEWLCGGFNICVPVTIVDQQRQPCQRVLLRFPLPYRIGEAFKPGNSDEKIRCEAGTYAWLEENCPDVPIPRLYGFALSTGETVSGYLSD